MAKLNQIFRCNVCWHIIQILHQWEGELVCCEQPMELLHPKGKDQEGKEKHVPVITKTDDGILVKIWENPHPMIWKHYIEWIEVLHDDISYRQYLHPDQEPQAKFPIDNTDVLAREYCNVHGLRSN